MSNILTPDKVINLELDLKVKQKIIPDSLKATKNVASWIKKGDSMKPCKKLNNGSGKPLGITIHNTEDIKVAANTTPAEQYTRATFAGNMGGVVVHYYVYENDIWQNLNDNERGWHAADGQTRRASIDGSHQIGGNLDTIAIECIGNNSTSEDTTARLAAVLCKKYKLNPNKDVYTHKYFYPSKNCPIYILPHWDQFLTKVKNYYKIITDSNYTAPQSSTTSMNKNMTSPLNTSNSFVSKEWKNDFKIRKVFSNTIDCKNQRNPISTIAPLRKATCLGISEGCYIIEYKEGVTKKIGYILFNGGIK